MFIAQKKLKYPARSDSNHTIIPKTSLSSVSVEAWRGFADRSTIELSGMHIYLPNAKAKAWYRQALGHGNASSIALYAPREQDASVNKLYLYIGVFVCRNTHWLRLITPEEVRNHLLCSV